MELQRFVLTRERVARRLANTSPVVGHAGTHGPVSSQSAGQGHTSAALLLPTTHQLEQIRDKANISTVNLTLLEISLQ